MAKRLPTLPAQNFEVADKPVTGGAGVVVKKGKGKKNRPARELMPGDLTEENGITTTILQGIRDGHLQAYWTTLDVTAKAQKAARSDYAWFIGIRALDGEGMLAGSNNKIDPAERDPEKLAAMSPEEAAAAKLKGACDIWNYGMDLERRRQYRKALMAKVEGPDRAVKKVVLGYLAMEEYTHDEIRAEIAKLKKFKDVKGLDKLVNAVLQANA